MSSRDIPTNPYNEGNATAEATVVILTAPTTSTTANTVTVPSTTANTCTVTTIADPTSTCVLCAASGMHASQFITSLFLCIIVISLSVYCIIGASLTYLPTLICLMTHKFVLEKLFFCLIKTHGLVLFN